MLIKKLNANQDCRDNIIFKKNIQYLILLLLFFFPGIRVLFASKD